MKVICNVERNGTVCKATITLKSSEDEDLSYEFQTYKDDAVDIVEKLMKEKGKISEDN